MSIKLNTSSSSTKGWYSTLLTIGLGMAKGFGVVDTLSRDVLQVILDSVFWSVMLVCCCFVMITSFWFEVLSVELLKIYIQNLKNMHPKLTKYKLKKWLKLRSVPVCIFYSGLGPGAGPQLHQNHSGGNLSTRGATSAFFRSDY